MIKTIKVKKEMNFTELMEYILENDIREREFRSRGNKYSFSVCEVGIFDFYCENYNVGETYEVEVEEEITEDTEFGTLVEIFDEGRIDIHYSERMKYVKDSTSKKIYALIDGDLQLVWERDADE